MPKNWLFWIVVLENPFDCKDIKPVNPKGNQSWIFTGRTNAEALVLSHLMWRADSLEKTLMIWKTDGKRRREWQRMKWLESITDWIWANSGRLWRMREPGMWKSVELQRIRQDLANKQQQQIYPWKYKDLHMEKKIGKYDRHIKI